MFYLEKLYIYDKHKLVSEVSLQSFLEVFDHFQKFFTISCHCRSTIFLTQSRLTILKRDSNDVLSILVISEIFESLKYIHRLFRRV